MQKLALVLSLLIVVSVGVFGQPTKSGKPGDSKTPATDGPIADAASLDLAKLTLAAHGGDKLKQLRSLVMRGSADITSFNQAIPATFVIIISGERYYFEINNPMQPLKQIWDGQQLYSSVRGFELPPITSLGFPLIPRIGDAGYIVGALPELKKKKRGFRITSPQGYYTDFFVDEKTNQLKGYESSYDYDGRLITTSVEIEKCQIVDGVLVPEKYSQRFDLGQVTAYASFKSKVILVNSKIEDDVFAMPK